MSTEEPPIWEKIFQERLKAFRESEAPKTTESAPELAPVAEVPAIKSVPSKLAAKAIHPHTRRPEMIIRQLLGVTDKIGELVVVAKIEDQTVLMASSETSGTFLTIAGAILEQAGVKALTAPSPGTGGKRA